MTQNKSIGMWLFTLAGMVLIMVAIGGITRLTGSGLSMVEWKPLTGWLPPLNHQEWLDIFHYYQKSPEFQKINSWMMLDDFKKIFWWEYIHRVWGRCIQYVFLLPFIYFLSRGFFSKKDFLRLLALFLTGAGQAFLGWYMVKSGLKDNPFVSHFRLTAHLSLAVILFSLLIYWGLNAYPFEKRASLNKQSKRFLHYLMILTALNIVMGGMVAGLKAGYIYNEFPLMGGHFIPHEYASYTPLYKDFLMNPVTIQFHHRLIALFILFYTGFMSRKIRKKETDQKNYYFLTFLPYLFLVQIILGIVTLLTHIHLHVAALHQIGAFICMAGIIVSRFYPTKKL